MAKKKKIVKPHYIPKDQRKKNKPMAKETKILILGICAAVIVAAVLFAIFYDDGSLPVRDGVVVTEGDNWIVGNLGTSSSPKYYKFGELTPLEGFTEDPDMSVKSDDNVKDYWFAADDESQEISAYYVCAVAQEPEQIAQTVHDQYIAFYGEGGSVGDVQSITLNGLEGAYFTSLFSQAVVEETEPEATDATADGAQQETEPEATDTPADGAQQEAEPEATDATADGAQQEAEPKATDTPADGAQEETSAETEETEETVYEQTQSVVCYLPAIRGNSVLISLQVDISETKPALTEEQSAAWLQKIADTLVLETE